MVGQHLLTQLGLSIRLLRQFESFRDRLRRGSLTPGTVTVIGLSDQCPAREARRAAAALRRRGSGNDSDLFPSLTIDC
eukprot:754567-Hanusia_phi.AAC.3